jgi:acyl carrier protein
MDEKTFLEQMDELLNVEESLTMETELKNVEEWDSLTALMFQSFVYKATGKAPNPVDIRKAETVSDLYDFMK